ncbi:ferrochelatase [Streptomyces sp. NPDC048410]|uniref:ferrochelatase n=1 Tax=Streptomyces sp. NPDC048410 TaxID=3365545 RepID=UPI00371C3ABB
MSSKPYDALLLLSFGGPEGVDDVVPFLENVTRGRGIPRERLVEVGEHYFRFGGVSPINQQNRELLKAIRHDFMTNDLNVPVYWGNRNWAPYVTDTMRDMVRAGHRRIAVLATSAYASYSGCRQYREDLAGAVEQLRVEGLPVPRIDKLRHYFNHPGFIEPMVDGVLDSLAKLPEDVRDGAQIAFTTHSLPVVAAENSGPPEMYPPETGGAYVAQHLDVAQTIMEVVEERTGVSHAWDLVFQSRSGAPHIPWLEPDICDHLEDLHAAGVKAVVMAPIGFVSDHMEVLFDLDTEAMDKASELGMEAERSATVGADPRFAAAIRDLLLERAGAERGCGAKTPCWTGRLGPSHHLCPANCCASPVPRPALAGED